MTDYITVISFLNVVQQSEATCLHTDCTLLAKPGLGGQEFHENVNFKFNNLILKPEQLVNEEATFQSSNFFLFN